MYKRQPFELVAPKRTTSAPSEQAALERAMSSPAGNDATDIVAFEVEHPQRSLWDDLGRSYNLNCNVLHKFIPSFGLKGTGTKPSSSSPSYLSSAALQDDSYQPGRAYHSAHEKLTVTTHRCQQAMSQVAQMRITSAPRDDGPSDEDVIVANIDDTSLTLSYDHSLLRTSSCLNLISARTQCSLRATSYMHAVHIAVDQHALLVA